MRKLENEVTWMIPGQKDNWEVDYGPKCHIPSGLLFWPRLLREELHTDGRTEREDIRSHTWARWGPHFSHPMTPLTMSQKGSSHYVSYSYFPTLIFRGSWCCTCAREPAELEARPTRQRPSWTPHRLLLGANLHQLQTRISLPGGFPNQILFWACCGIFFQESFYNVSPLSF